jgi:hypothetical protein
MAHPSIATAPDSDASSNQVATAAAALSQLLPSPQGDRVCSKERQPSYQSRVGIPVGQWLVGRHD